LSTDFLNVSSLLTANVQLKRMRTEGNEVRLMKSITIVVAVVVLLSCSGFGANSGEASGSEKRIQELIKQLDSSAWVRATTELVRIGEPAVDPLLRALNQNSHWISARASNPLSKIRSEKAVDGLLKALDNTKLDGRIKRYILQSLGNVKSERVLKPLIRYLGHEDWAIRCAVLRSLGQIRGQTAEEAAIVALKDKQRYVVESAIAVLGQMKSTRAPAHLIEILEDRERMGRIKISRALVEIGEPSVEAILSSMRNDMDREICWHLVWALGHINSDAAIEPLVQALKSRNWMVRNEAAVSLVRIDSLISTKPLRRLLESGHDNSRQEVEWILKTLESGHGGLPEDSSVGETNSGDLTQVSAAEDTSPVTFEDKSYALCPYRFDSRPSVASPYATDDGREIVVTSTKDDKYMLIPVTLANTERKGRQLHVNADDFPTLGRTGFHCELELDRTRIITGRSIAEITELARPDRLSTSGFIAEDEDIISVLKGDNRFARNLGLSHAQLAKPLFHVLNLTARNQEQKNHLSYQGHRAEYPPFFYNGKKISVKVEYTRGGQESIFADSLDGALAVQIRRDLQQQEKNYIESKYSHLSRQQREDLVKKLSSLFIGEMVMYYIKWYGFYEGHTGWRADPIAIAFIFGMKDLEQIDAAFDGKLYDALTEHFTRQ
jgi:HEAT repeat protein